LEEVVRFCFGLGLRGDDSDFGGIYRTAQTQT
jgi:hypothetical protein